MSIETTIEAIRALPKEGQMSNVSTDQRLYCSQLHELADGYEALQAEHERMMRFFGIEYEGLGLDGERHWKYKPSAMQKHLDQQAQAEYEALAAENEALAAENAELRKEIAAINRGAKTNARINKSLTKQNAELRAALGHYAWAIKLIDHNT